MSVYWLYKFLYTHIFIYFAVPLSFLDYYSNFFLYSLKYLLEIVLDEIAFRVCYYIVFHVLRCMEQH